MRIDSAILSNAIITASADNPIVSGSSQVDITNTTGYSTFSSSIKTYADAKVAGIVNSAPATLDTLDELAAALGDDANMSASFATTLGTKLPTATHTAFSSSNASAIRTEYTAGDSALSASAHSDRVAKINVLSGSAHTQRAAIDAKIAALDSTYATDASVSSLSASAHTRREEISASLDATIDALDSLGISTDTERGALSSSAHTQRVALNSAQTTANNTLSSSIATALRAEITSGDAAFLTSASIGATINDNAVKLSGIESGATADQSDSEIKTAYENNSDTNAFTDALLSKLNAIEASADVTDTANVTSAGALMDSEVTNLDQVKAFDSSDYIASASNGAKLNAIEAGADVTDATNVAAAGALMSSSLGGTINDNVVKLAGIEAGADVTDTTNVTAAGALMDSELTNLAAVKAINQGLTTTSAVTFGSGLISNDFTIDGNLTVRGDTIQADVTNLNVEDKNILIASGAADSAAADGAGITIAGANEDITWDHSNSRFNFSDDVHVVGNVTLSGTVDGRNVADDGTKLDGIEASADVTDTTNVTAAGALMDSECTSLADVKALDQSVISGADPTFGTANMTDATNKRFMTDAQETKLDSVETNADVTDTTNVVAALTAGSNITISAGGEISATDTNTTYSVGDGGLTENNFTDALKTKLDGIEASADVTDTTNVVAALTAGSNITISAGGEISATDTNTTYSVGDGGLTENNFTDALKTKLDGIETSADVTDTTNVVAALTAGSNITIAADGTISSTDTDTNTTYSAGDGISLSGTTFSITKGTSGDWWGDKVAHIASDGVMEIGRYIDFHGTDGNTDDYTVRLDGLSDTLAVSGHITSTGNITATGDVTAYSDETLKKDVKTIEGALDKTKELRGVEFTRIADDSKSIGVIAQELEKVLPELVSTDDEGIKSVNYAQITGLLIEAVKELSAKVEELSK